MINLPGRFSRMLADETGATSIEYALLAGLVALAIVLSAAAIGTELSSTFEDVDEGLVAEAEDE